MQIGKRVAIIGAGGIGFDVATFITDPAHDAARTSAPSTSLDVDAFLREWGIDKTNSVRGGIEGVTPHHYHPEREVYLLQRRKGKLGGGLGKTTGWIHRAELKNRGVHMLGGVSYDKIDDDGLWITDRKVVYLLSVPVLCIGCVFVGFVSRLPPVAEQHGCCRGRRNCWRSTQLLCAQGRSHWLNWSRRLLRRLCLFSKSAVPWKLQSLTPSVPLTRVCGWRSVLKQPFLVSGMRRG